MICSFSSLLANRLVFFFSSRRRHTRWNCDWSPDVCSSDLALSVDLTGQINAESVFGSRMINGTGGQPEFQIGAALSRGGRAITLLPSTALDGAVSRVVSQHEAGSM